MMGTALRYGLALMLGAAIGIGSMLYMAGLWPGMKPLDFGDIEVRGWRADFAIGSNAADPYTRARVARHGLLALAKSEAVYFTRTTDSSGEHLREECIYRLKVAEMPAEWWSVTLYDADSKLPMNEDEALSINADQNVFAEANEEDVGAVMTAIIAPQKPQENRLWISSRGAGNFDLTLRLYMPDEALLADPQSALEPPSVERLSCEDEA